VADETENQNENATPEAEVADETENQNENETPEAEASEETVSAPEGPVAPAPDTAEPEPPQTEEEVVEDPAAAEETLAEAEPAPDAEAEAAAAQAPEPKKKRKRLPRAERHKHSKPKRERPAQRKPITRLPKPESERGRRQERRGVVVSSSMDKTIVVRVDAVKAHPRYKKVVRRSTKFHAHDEQNQANVGDVVRIVETRPLSKTKNWRLAEVLEVAR
jgi:small subunit ribosomal protein S17